MSHAGPWLPHWWGGYSGCDGAGATVSFVDTRVPRASVPIQAQDVAQRPRSGGSVGTSRTHAARRHASRSASALRLGLVPHPSPGDGRGRGRELSGQQPDGIALVLQARRPCIPAWPGLAAAAWHDLEGLPRACPAGRWRVCPAAHCAPAGGSRWRRSHGRQRRGRRPRGHRAAGQRAPDVRPRTDPSHGPGRAGPRCSHTPQAAASRPPCRPAAGACSPPRAAHGPEGRRTARRTDVGVAPKALRRKSREG